MFIASLRQEALADGIYPGALDGYGPEHVNTLTNRCIVNADYRAATVDCDPSLLKINIKTEVQLRVSDLREDADVMGQGLPRLSAWGHLWIIL